MAFCVMSGTAIHDPMPAFLFRSRSVGYHHMHVREQQRQQHQCRPVCRQPAAVAITSCRQMQFGNT